MDDLIVFLRARHDEEAALATEATQETTGRWTARTTANGDTLVEDDDGALILPTVRTQGVVQYQHIAHQDPARVLREIDAKRQILHLHRPVHRRSTGSGTAMSETCGICDHFPGQHPCLTLRLLSLPYADHADYQQSWRP